MEEGATDKKRICLIGHALLGNKDILRKLEVTLLKQLSYSTSVSSTESSTVLTIKTKLDILWNCNRFDYL